MHYNRHAIDRHFGRGYRHGRQRRKLSGVKCSGMDRGFPSGPPRFDRKEQLRRHAVHPAAGRESSPLKRRPFMTEDSRFPAPSPSQPWCGFGRRTIHPENGPSSSSSCQGRASESPLSSIDRFDGDQDVHLRCNLKGEPANIRYRIFGSRVPR